jgi:hypothetical protein
MKPSKEELELLQKFRTIKEIAFIYKKSESWINNIRKNYGLLKKVGRPKKGE